MHRFIQIWLLFPIISGQFESIGYFDLCACTNQLLMYIFSCIYLDFCEMSFFFKCHCLSPLMFLSPHAHSQTAVSDPVDNHRFHVSVEGKSIDVYVRKTKTPTWTNFHGQWKIAFDAPSWQSSDMSYCQRACSDGLLNRQCHLQVSDSLKVII